MLNSKLEFYIKGNNKYILYLRKNQKVAMPLKPCRNGSTCSFIKRLLKGEMLPEDYTHFNTFSHKQEHLFSSHKHKYNNKTTSIEKSLDNTHSDNQLVKTPNSSKKNTYHYDLWLESDAWLEPDF